jgi:hypothetical protein
MCTTCGCEIPLEHRRREIAVAAGRALTPDEKLLLAVEDTLEQMDRWSGWNGVSTRGGGSVWTPQKSTRRITDHLIDHLTQIECRIAGVEPVPDTWRGRRVTLDSDWARFSELDFEEARARIRRVAQVLALQIRAHEELWDDGGEWSLRGIVDHLIQAMESYRAKPPLTASA